jgi:hypothetical protein
MFDTCSGYILGCSKEACTCGGHRSPACCLLLHPWVLLMTCLSLSCCDLHDLSFDERHLYTLSMSACLLPDRLLPPQTGCTHRAATPRLRPSLSAWDCSQMRQGQQHPCLPPPPCLRGAVASHQGAEEAGWRQACGGEACSAEHHSSSEWSCLTVAPPSPQAVGSSGGYCLPSPEEVPPGQLSSKLTP